MFLSTSFLACTASDAMIINDNGDNDNGDNDNGDNDNDNGDNDNGDGDGGERGRSN